MNLSEYDDLRDVFDRAMTDLSVPTARLCEGATRTGRRLRWRRRALVGAGGLAAAAAVGAFLVPLVGGSGDTARDPGMATEPPADPSGRPSAASSAEPPTEPFVARPGYWDMPAQEMRDRAAGLLPEGVTISSYERKNTEHAPGESDEMVGDLRATLSGPSGPGSLEVGLIQSPDVEPIFTIPADPSALDGVDLTSTDFSCNPANFWVKPTVCETLTDAQGQPYGVIIELTDAGVTTRTVKLIANEGVVRASVANSVERKWTPPTSAAEPPLTLDQLQAVATSATWTDWTPPAK